MSDGEFIAEAEARSWIEWGWVETFYGYSLHYPIDGELDPDLIVMTNATLACGRHVRYVSLPGMFTRMHAERCDLCCKALGYPYGIGSPKNDDACRPLVEARLTPTDRKETT